MLRVTVLELPATWAEPRRVLDAVDQELARGPGTDLVLLPEASLTGYVSAAGDFDLTPFAEPLDGPTRHAVSALARRHHVALVAPLVLREGAACFNAMIACDARGELLLTYRKRHPWYPETWATPGREPAPVVTLAGTRITMAICFDLQFVEDDERPTRLPELAKRYRIAIANANWSAGVVTIPGQGASSIVGPDGAVLAHTAPTAVAELTRGTRLAGMSRADAVLEVTRPAS